MEPKENLEKEHIQVSEGKNTIELSRPYGGIQHVEMREPIVQDLLLLNYRAKENQMQSKKLQCLQIFVKLHLILVKGLGLCDYSRLQDSYRLFTS